MEEDEEDEDEKRKGNDDDGGSEDGNDDGTPDNDVFSFKLVDLVRSMGEKLQPPHPLSLSVLVLVLIVVAEAFQLVDRSKGSFWGKPNEAFFISSSLLSVFIDMSVAMSEEQ